MANKYILNDEGKPVLEPDLIKWSRWFEKADRHAGSEWIGEVRVSTVFLGLDHNYDHEGCPILWETMVFRGDLSGEQDRCGGCKQDALEMHKNMVRRVRATETKVSAETPAITKTMSVAKGESKNG